MPKITQEQGQSLMSLFLWKHTELRIGWNKAVLLQMTVYEDWQEAIVRLLKLLPCILFQNEWKNDFKKILKSHSVVLWHILEATQKKGTLQLQSVGPFSVMIFFSSWTVSY